MRSQSPSGSRLSTFRSSSEPKLLEKVWGNDWPHLFPLTSARKRTHPSNPQSPQASRSQLPSTGKLGQRGVAFSGWSLSPEASRAQGRLTVHAGSQGLGAPWSPLSRVRGPDSDQRAGWRPLVRGPDPGLGVARAGAGWTPPGPPQRFPARALGALPRRTAASAEQSGPVSSRLQSAGVWGSPRCPCRGNRRRFRRCPGGGGGRWRRRRRRRRSGASAWTSLGLDRERSSMRGELRSNAFGPSALNLPFASSGSVGLTLSWRETESPRWG